VYSSLRYRARRNEGRRRRGRRSVARLRPSPPRASWDNRGQADTAPRRRGAGSPRGAPRSYGRVVANAALRPGQVFGLVDVAVAAYCSPLPGLEPVSLCRAQGSRHRETGFLPSAYGEGRFHTPLRGSAGFKPASLLISSLYSDKEMKTSARRTIAARRGAVKSVRYMATRRPGEGRRRFPKVELVTQRLPRGI
jgi:hypothetical protein